MQAQRVLFADKGHVVLEAAEVVLPSRGELLLETIFAVISPGTEQTSRHESNPVEMP